MHRAIAIASLFVLACAHGSDGPRASSSAEANLAATRLTAPPDVAITIACTPTGPELCFNAIDDNCNGVIDEGCGVGTGVLQFTIAWSESAADVDLAVRMPNGTVISESNKEASGMKLDRDCPGNDGCNGQNIENVYFFDSLEPPRGHYEVIVKLADLHGVPPPIHVRLGARMGTKTSSYELVLAQTDEKKMFPFDL